MQRRSMISSSHQNVYSRLCYECLLKHHHPSPSTVLRQPRSNHWQQRHHCTATVSSTVQTRCDTITYGQSRRVHSSPLRPRNTTEHAPSSLHHYDPSHFQFGAPTTSTTNSTIREQLKAWQAQFGQPNIDQDLQDIFPRFKNAGIESDDAGRSVEDFENGFPDALDLEHQAYKPGDLCLFPDAFGASASTSQPEFMVLIRYIEDQEAQWLTSYGTYIQTGAQYVLYGLSSFVDPSELEVLLPFLPVKILNNEESQILKELNGFDSQVPRHVSAPLLRKMATFRQNFGDIYRKFFRRLDSAYDLLAHHTETRIWHMDEIANALLGSHFDRSEEQLMAVRMAMYRGGNGITWDFINHHATEAFFIRSTKELQKLNIVHSWAREYQSYQVHEAAADGVGTPDRERGLATGIPYGATVFHKFFEKARRLIDQSRTWRDLKIDNAFSVGPGKIRHDISHESAALKPVYGETFSEEDSLIIAFIRNWAYENRYAYKPMMRATCHTIIRGVGRYDPLVSISAGVAFLQEIGAMPPYEGLHLHNESLMLPHMQHSTAVDLLHMDAASPRHARDLNDSMAGLRKDWKDTPVFCIDGTSAEEIDDGISVETIHTESSPQWWIHVHVAHPGAFFKEDHVLAKYAEHMTTAMYMPERNFPMLPKWATQSHFSLGANKPVLTFSGRIDKKGNLLESRIQPGIIRNVIYTTADTIARTTGLHMDNTYQVRYVVGGAVPHISSIRGLRSEFTKEELDAYRSLHEATKSLRAMSMSHTNIMHNSDISVYSSQRPGLPPTILNPTRAMFIEGDPVIALESTRWQSEFNPLGTLGGTPDANEVVTSCMVLAGHIGAEWCSKRQIPCIYRGTKSGVGDYRKFLDEIVTPSLDKNGRVPYFLRHDMVRATGSALDSVTPVPHGSLGLSSYSRVTSPLRRYTDLVNHWQIDAALREEARAGKELLGGDLSLRTLPFSSERIEKVLARSRQRFRIIGFTTRKAENHWQAHLIERARFEAGNDFPQTITVMVTGPGKNPQLWDVACREFALKARMLDPVYFTRGLTSNEFKRMPNRGDIWECKWESVQYVHGTVMLRPIRLLNRWKATGEKM